MSYEFDEEDHEELAGSNAKVTGDGITIKIDAGALGVIAQTVAQRVEQQMMRKVEPVVLKALNAAIDAKVNDVIGAMAEKAVEEYLAKPRIKTNSYGEVIGGGTMTFSEMIPTKVEAWLKQSVKSDGTPITDSYDRKSGVDRIDWIINKMVKTELDVATKEAAGKVTEQAKKVVSESVGRFIADQLVPSIEARRR